MEVLFLEFVLFPCFTNIGTDLHYISKKERKKRVDAVKNKTIVTMPITVSFDVIFFMMKISS